MEPGEHVLGTEPSLPPSSLSTKQGNVPAVWGPSSLSLPARLGFIGGVAPLFFQHTRHPVSLAPDLARRAHNPNTSPGDTRLPPMFRSRASASRPKSGDEVGERGGGSLEKMPPPPSAAQVGHGTASVPPPRPSRFPPPWPRQDGPPRLYVKRHLA